MSNSTTCPPECPNPCCYEMTYRGQEICKDSPKYVRENRTQAIIVPHTTKCKINGCLNNCIDNLDHCGSNECKYLIGIMLADPSTPMIPYYAGYCWYCRKILVDDHDACNNIRHQQLYCAAISAGILPSFDPFAIDFEDLEDLQHWETF